MRTSQVSVAVLIDDALWFLMIGSANEFLNFWIEAIDDSIQHRSILPSFLRIRNELALPLRTDSPSWVGSWLGLVVGRVLVYGYMR